MTELSTIVSGRGDWLVGLVIFGSLLINVIQLIINARKDSCFGRVSDLETKLAQYLQKMEEQEKKIENLENQVFELSKENAELKGLTEVLRENQKMKEEYFNQLKNNN